MFIFGHDECLGNVLEEKGKKQAFLRHVLCRSHGKYPMVLWLNTVPVKVSRLMCLLWSRVEPTCARYSLAVSVQHTYVGASAIKELSKRTTLFVLMYS